jgi:glutamate-1-semialdehyde 2,1-aminomutase
MLKKGFLAGNSVNVSIAHTDKILNEYENCLDEVFFNITKFEKEGFRVDEILEGPICHTEFRRLN